MSAGTPITSLALEANMRQAEIKYKRSKKGLLGRIYADQRMICRKKDRNLPTYTLEELREWAYSQHKFHTLYDNWKRLDYQKKYRPSCDRIDDTISYTMANIQLMTWGENEAKARADIKSGKLKQRQKAVKQYTIDGEFLAEYHAILEATRQTNVHRNTIVWVCEGKRKTAGGFTWRYK